MAAANEQIGIARAAYYPTLSLSAVAGFAGTSALNWLSWPSRFFAVGPTLSETLFDHGRRRATSDIALAQYDGTIAAYRQTTLTAFQQVEDNLNALHNLEIEARQQHDATASAQQSLDLFNTRYEDGVDTYLQVITWQTALLQAVCRVGAPYLSRLQPKLDHAARYHKLLDHIRLHCSAGMTVGELSEHFHQSRAVLSKGFQRCFGVPLTTFGTRPFW